MIYILFQLLSNENYCFLCAVKVNLLKIINKQITFLASTHLTLDCKRQMYRSHVLIFKKLIYQLYLNKQYQSLCFSRDIRKTILLSLLSSDTYISSYT